jgi:hypothetical protein
MFWIFTNKKRVEEVREETKKGFDSVKKDILNVSEWIKHLDIQTNIQQTDINDIKGVLSSIKEEIIELKKITSEVNLNNLNNKNQQVFKTNSHNQYKQTGVFAIQTNNQTAVQTPNLSNFSITERAIISILLNSDMRLSYEDLATMLNKTKSTIRGQINTIKSKSESLIQEIIEKNGKKRVYIHGNLKEKLLKKAKVRINNKNFEE